MIKLRQLQEKDAELMLEWMHDPSIQRNFQRDMLNSNFNDVSTFIKNSNQVTVNNIRDGESIHFAIVDDIDEYLGTVSLKHVSLKNKNAEYAIVTRNKCKGKSIGKQATLLILDFAFSELKLNKVYLNVLSNNTRAIKMYEKVGFHLEGIMKQQVVINGQYDDLVWYGILKNEYTE